MTESKADVVAFKIKVWERKVAEHNRLIAIHQAEINKFQKWLAEDEAKLALLRERQKELLEVQS